jgi:hypothetical protein
MPIPELEYEKRRDKWWDVSSYIKPQYEGDRGGHPGWRGNGQSARGVYNASCT